MKKLLLNIIMVLLLGGSLIGCGDFGDLNKDPNKPTATDNRYLFIDAARYIRYFHIVGTYNPFPQHFSHYWAERQNVQYTVLNLNSYSIGGYYQRLLKDLRQIVETNLAQETAGSSLVAGLGSSENQIAVAETLIAFVYMHLSDVLGMIPYSEALKGVEGNFTPKYDTQESIYADLDKRLTEAYKMFNPAGTFSSQYDIFYKGDINKWKKFNASIRMLLAIKMTKVDPVNGKARFAAAYADGGIQNNADNFNYYYLPESNNENPLYNNIFVGKRDDFAPTTTMMEVLKAHNDPRIGAYFQKNKYDEYVGIPFGMLAADLSKSGLTALASKFTPRFTNQDAVGTITCASQIYLHAAEAAALGWISDSAEDLYHKGIKASFDLNEKELKASLDLKELPASLYLDYIAQEKVKLVPGDMNGNIKKISLQKWIQGFGQDCFESWAEWRRNRVPELRIGPAAGADLEGKEMPDRMFYASGDYTSNRAEYEKAVATQGSDNYFTKIWWGK